MSWFLDIQPVRQPSGLQPSRGQPPMRGQQPMRGRPVSNTPPNSAPINRVPNPNFRPEVPQNNNTNNTNGISFQPMRPAPQPPVQAAQSAVGNKPALPPKPSTLTQPVNVVNSPAPTVPGKPPSPPLNTNRSGSTPIIQVVQKQPFQQLEAQVEDMINNKVRPALATRNWLSAIQVLEEAGDLLMSKYEESTEPLQCTIKACYSSLLLSKSTMPISIGPTRGGKRVIEWNPKNNQVRQWYECCDRFDKVNRVHPKEINGQVITSPHYPPTGRELTHD